jgi:Flp pilus assembly CpaF family ATPase
VAKKVKQLAEILLEQGIVSQEQLDAAVAEQTATGKRLGRILIDMGLVKEQDLVAALASQIGLRFVDLSDSQVDATASAMLPEQVARKYRALPIGYEEDKLVVAMADPANLFALDDIRTITGMDVQPVVATAADIEAAIRKYSHFDESVETVVSEASAAAEDDVLELERLAQSAVDEGPIVKMVNLLITQAIGDRASDIHIEPSERDVRIRYRVDGVLHEVMRSPKNVQAGLISRLKVMADINIAERRVPQDGRISLNVGGKSVDLRVATLPTVYGEKVVIRVLDKSSVLLRLEDLGFLEEAYKSFEGAFTKPYGAILVTGPTGSGKSTTLYATLNQINSPERNIITVEDPVEYRLAGINQVQVNNRAGLTFASALRSILRADPDVVLIGEIRDRGRPHRSPRALHPAHQRRAVLASPPRGDGRRALPGGERHRLHRGPASPAQAVHEVQGDLQARQGRARAGRIPRVPLGGHRGAVPARRVQRVCEDRLPGPPGHLRDHARLGGHRAHGGRACLVGRDQAVGRRRRDDPASRGRAGESADRRHVGPGSPSRRGVEKG